MDIKRKQICCRAAACIAEDQPKVSLPLEKKVGDPEAMAMEDSLSPFLPLTSETVVERTRCPNGSGGIKTGTLTPRANGYQDVRVEYFIIPSSNPPSVRYYTSPGSPPPLPDHLTRVEYHVIPPGSDAPKCDDDNDDSNDSTVNFSLPVTSRRVHFEGDSFDSVHTRTRNVRRKNNIAISIMGVLTIVLFVIVGLALTLDYRSHLQHETSQDIGHDVDRSTSPNATLPNDVEHVNGTNVLDNESRDITPPFIYASEK